ncbi:MAG: phosphotransferase [Acidobacteria bacterium]|nr:phosphotransferase [Acidobacteriota bacterium]
MERRSWVREIELAGDASYRRYTRLVAASGATAIRVTYPAERAQALVRDRDVLAWLSERGLRVPQLLGLEQEPGQLYVEDFGDQDAEQGLRHLDSVARWEYLGRLLSPLVTLATIPADDLPRWNPPLDTARLREELRAFENWFLKRLIARPSSPEVGGWLDDLAAAVGGHPVRVCHRDYHLNNLYFLGEGRVGVIDAQDVLIGPDTYDAASLVGERAFPELVGKTETRGWLDLWANATDAQSGWERRVLETGTQRALKVLGTFARLELNGKPGYRRWMKPLARRAVEAVRDLVAPPQLVDTLLDFEVGGSHVR